MSKLKLSTREIGSVYVFDLMGEPTDDSLEEVASKIQKNIRRHRLQRVILNLQMLPHLEPLSLRKLLTACIRPQKSLLYGVSTEMAQFLENTYVPKNMRICKSEKEVAEDLGPFLLEKDGDNEFPAEDGVNPEQTAGYQIERRRSKRMKVALPIELKIHLQNGELLESRAIATNISEGGLFAEYLDLEAAGKMEKLEPFQGFKVDIRIFPSANFPEEYQLQGKINRKEFRKKQLGIALEFLA